MFDEKAPALWVQADNWDDRQRTWEVNEITWKGENAVELR